MISVLTIGYSKGVFQEGDERARLKACADAAGALHMIVFTRHSDGCVDTHDDSLNLYPTNSRTKIGMLIDAYRIGRKLFQAEETTPDIISTQDPFESGFIGYILHRHFGAPLQVQEHGDFFASSAWKRESFLNRFRYVFGKWLVRRASCIRAVSLRVEEHLSALGVDSTRISRLAVNTPLSMFRTSCGEQDIRAQYPHTEALIVAAGRLVKQKRFDLLIDSFKDVRAQYPSTILIIVGSGREEQALKQQAETLGISKAISFVPWVESSAPYLRAADIFVLTSAYEGWGRVIVEAMAAGVPSVVTDVGCVGEVFIDDRHGIVVPVFDTHALTEAMKKLIGDKAHRTRYGAAAAQESHMLSQSSEEYARAWVATLDACLTKSPL